MIDAASNEERDGATHARPNLRATQRARTREVFLDAAEGVFALKSYVEVTVDDVARQAGASRATFYLHFDGKAAWMCAVASRLHGSAPYRELFDRLTHLRELDVETMQPWFEDYLDLLERQPGLQRAIYQAQAVEPSVTEMMLSNLQFHLDLFARHGLVSQSDPEALKVAGVMLYALTEQVPHLWRLPGLELDRSTTTRLLAESLDFLLDRTTAVDRPDPLPPARSRRQPP